MNKTSPFSVDTNAGPLQLTKGAFLTLQKRKNSTFRTLSKTKPILKDSCKPTVKRLYRPYGDYDSPPDEVAMHTRGGDEVRFTVCREADKFRWKMLKSLPTIEMAYDNDEESEWCEIEGSVTNLTLSLSLAAYDNRQ